MVLSHEDLRRARPRCIKCSNTKEAKLQRKIQEIVQPAVEAFQAQSVPPSLLEAYRNRREAIDALVKLGLTEAQARELVTEFEWAHLRRLNQ
jgi:hypothetical protein